MTKVEATTTKPAADVQVGDIIPTTYGNNFGTFEVESVTWFAYRDGSIAVTFEGYEKVNAGCCGPQEMSFMSDAPVAVAA
jgi:hypothetical protein